MAWIALTETDLLRRLSGSELTPFKESALSGSEGDVVAQILAETIDLARGYIGVQYTLGASGTIPSKLKSTVLDIAVVDVMKRVGGVVIDPNGERRGAKDDAIRLLEQVAAGRYAIEEPTTADGEDIGHVVPSFEARDAEFGREFEDGL